MSDQFEICLTCGVNISLDSLFQYRTYSGSYVGLPTKKRNIERIERAAEYAAHKLWGVGPVHVLQPQFKPMDIPREKWRRPDDEFEPTRIPPIACLGDFQSWMVCQDGDADGSSLKIVWFQDSFGPPTDQGVLAQFRAIDWRALAKDWFA